MIYRHRREVLGVAALDAGVVDAVTVEVDGWIAYFLTGVPVSRAIALADLVAGRTVALVMFDAGNPDGGMVTGVY